MKYAIIALILCFSVSEANAVIYCAAGHLYRRVRAATWRRCRRGAETRRWRRRRRRAKMPLRERRARLQVAVPASKRADSGSQHRLLV